MRSFDSIPQPRATSEAVQAIATMAGFVVFGLGWGLLEQTSIASGGASTFRSPGASGLDQNRAGFYPGYPGSEMNSGTGSISETRVRFDEQGNYSGDARANDNRNQFLEQPKELRGEHDGSPGRISR
jgi:hypothetical protein